MGVYNGKTGDEWRTEADGYYYDYKRTNDDWYLTLYRQATLKAQIADDEPDDTTPGGGSSDPKYITGTSGADSIYNTITGAMIAAFGGNDSIISYGGNNFINGGSDDDRIYNGYRIYSSGITLVGSSSSNDTVDGGDGNDYIENYASNSSIVGGAGKDSIINGYDRLSTGTIVSGGSKDTVAGGAGNDSIRNYASNSLIDGGDGDDTISNATAGLTRDGAIKSTIYGGNGNDDIWNSRDSVTMSGDDGNDIIFNNGNRVSIFGGSGNDTIKNYVNSGSERHYGEKVTINGGAGNDLISLSSSYYNSLIEYQSGDGNDKIYGFKNSTLQIGGGTGTYSSTKSGSDIIVTVGEGKITLSGVSSAKIQGTLVNSGDTTSGGDNDTNSGGSSDEKLITGTEGNDSIKNTISGATINALGGNDSINNTYSGYALSSAGSYSYIFGNAGNDYVCNDVFADYSYINGGSGNDTIFNLAASSTVYGAEGDDSIRNVTGDVSIDGGAGNDIINDDSSYNSVHNTILGSTGNDTISLNSSAANDLIKYSSGDGNDIIYGFNTTSTLQIGGGTGTYSSTKSGSDIIVTVGEGKITLVDAVSLSAVNIAGNESTNSSDNSDALTYNGHRYYLYSEHDFTWKEAKAYCESLGGHLVTITDEGEQSIVNNLIRDRGSKGNYWLGGFEDSDGTWQWITGEKFDFTNWNSGEPNNIPKTAQALSVYTENYRIGKWNDSPADCEDIEADLGSYFYKNNFGFICEWDTLENSWTLNGSTATYGTSLETLISVDGVKSLDGLKVKGNVVTVSDSSLDKKNVTVSDGYTLKLGKDVTKTSATKTWSRSKDVATYNQTTSAGYKLADNAIAYSAKSTETLATVKGVKAVSGLKVKGTAITVAASSLNKKNVTVSDGYTLKLGSDVTKPSATKAWSRSKDVATYNQTTSAGYKLADNAITYSAKSTETLATVKGVKAVSGLKVKGNVITVSDSSLNKKNITVSDGYTLKLGSDVTKTLTKKAAWVLNDSTATYTDVSNTAGYSLANDKKSIVYSKAKTGKTLVTIDGVNTLKGISLKENVVTIKPSALSDKVFVSGNYEFDLAAGNYKGKLISSTNKANIITSRGKNISIDSGAGNDTIKILGSATVKGGAGNDSLWGSSSKDNFIYEAGDGKDIIYGFDDKDTLTLDGLDFKTSCKNDAITLKFDDGSLTLKDFTATTFHINNDTYKISGKKLVATS